ncbi:MAG: hypothetical protein LUI13_03355 [Lachnospiraceae bacterium]|nr:hypothetical protein [Lachnospiraceae bacterium]
MAKKKTEKTSPFVPVEEQPYQVPTNWCWIRLGDVYEINPKIKAKDEIDAAFIPMEKNTAWNA